MSIIVINGGDLVEKSVITLLIPYLKEKARSIWTPILYWPNTNESTIDRESVDELLSPAVCYSVREIGHEDNIFNHIDVNRLLSTSFTISNKPIFQHIQNYTLQDLFH